MAALLDLSRHRLTFNYNVQTAVMMSSAMRVALAKRERWREAETVSHAPNTIRRRLSAIGKAHHYNSPDWNAGHRDIQEPLRGALREHGRPPKQAAALTLELLQRLLEACDLSPGGRRDRAMLLIGFAAALRRSELVGLKVRDIIATRDGLEIRLSRSKIDQDGKGALISLLRGEHRHTRPMRAL